jgi:hypothetical protein
MRSPDLIPTNGGNRRIFASVSFWNSSIVM